MKLLAWRCACKDCDFEFKLPNLSEESYGEFIMRTETGQAAYLNAFHDQGVFEEFQKIFKSLRKQEGLPEGSEGSVVFKDLYSITCDPAPDGSIYQIRLFAVCPECGGKNISTWGSIYPGEVIDCDIPEEIPHEAWKKLSYEEKVNRTREAIKEYLNKTGNQ